ncbi:MAG: serine/threonine-protein kinase [Kofleriaceae bacterium]|nr:serine/threonine-protein kinase [Kofleriaceae bacterium]
MSGSGEPQERYCPQCERSFVIDEPLCPDDGTRLVNLEPQPDPLLGRIIDDRYTIVERIAVGGMGAVYRANQHSVEREVAIKVMRPGLVAEPDTLKRFLREAKLASQLAHPNTVGVLDFGQTAEGMFYLVMELIVGRTLDDVLLQEGVLDARRLVRIGVQICDALEAAHAMSIIHRDLKPSNILLLDHSRDLVKVVDFGLAKSLEGDVSMTRSGGMCGTPAFLAPERACGQPCDHRSDLYSLGGVLYLLGSGRLPFMSDSVPELLRMQVAEPAPLMTGVPFALAEVIDRLLAKDPAARYQSAAALREALEEALPVTGQLTMPPRAWQRPSTCGKETVASLPDVEEVRERAGSEAVAAPPALAPRPMRRRRWWLAGGFAMLAGLATLVPEAQAPEAAANTPEPTLPSALSIETTVLEARVDEPAPAVPRPRTKKLRPRLPF